MAFDFSKLTEEQCAMLEQVTEECGGQVLQALRKAVKEMQMDPRVKRLEIPDAAIAGGFVPILLDWIDRHGEEGQIPLTIIKEMIEDNGR